MNKRPQADDEVDLDFLVRYVTLDRQGGLYRVILETASHGRMTALLTAGGVWTLVDQLSMLLREENAAHEARIKGHTANGIQPRENGEVR